MSTKSTMQILSTYSIARGKFAGLSVWTEPELPGLSIFTHAFISSLRMRQLWDHSYEAAGLHKGSCASCGS